MCGVIAFIGNGINQKLIDKLVYESEVRGTHHTGKVKFKLQSFTGKEHDVVISHTRYATSGEVNQPLKINSKVLAFNGVIHQGTKKEMEREFKIKMKTDNDGEIILQKCKTPENVLDFISFNQCSFAGVMLFGNGRFVAMRNQYRPLWMHKAKNGVLLASTKDIFVRSGIKTNLKELEPLKIYEW